MVTDFETRKCARSETDLGRCHHPWLGNRPRNRLHSPSFGEGDLLVRVYFGPPTPTIRDKVNSLQRSGLNRQEFDDAVCSC